MFGLDAYLEALRAEEERDEDDTGDNALSEMSAIAGRKGLGYSSVAQDDDQSGLQLAMPCCRGREQPAPKDLAQRVRQVRLAAQDVVNSADTDERAEVRYNPMQFTMAHSWTCGSTT